MLDYRRYYASLSYSRLSALLCLGESSRLNCICTKVMAFAGGKWQWESEECVQEIDPFCRIIVCKTKDMKTTIQASNIWVLNIIRKQQSFVYNEETKSKSV